MTTHHRLKYVLAALLLVMGGIGNAWADRHHRHHSTHFGVYVGPVWGPVYYPPPRYYYEPPPTIVIERAPPPVYIEQAAPQPDRYWYYCRASRAYYPYVNECPSGWQRVSPQPPQR